MRKQRAEAAEGHNIHLPYDQPVQVHHRVVACLAHKHTPQGRVLDVGCGLGYTLQELRRLNPGLSLHAADTDEVCLRLTRAKVADVTTIRMRQGCFDVESLGSGYDACILSHVLEHLPRPLESVQKLLSILNPGGHLILAVPNPVCPAVFLNSILRRRIANPSHLQAWDRSHWMCFLENGVRAEVVEYAGDEVRVLPGRWKRKLGFVEKAHVALAKALPWWSYSNIAVIRRPGS